MTAANAADILTRHAERDPSAPAIVEPARTIDHPPRERAAWRAAASFRAQGIAPGDVVGLAMGSSALHIVASWGLARAGAVQVGLSELTSGRAELERRLRVKTVIAAGEESWLAPGGGEIDCSVRTEGGDAGCRIATTPAAGGRARALLHPHAMRAASCAATLSASRLSSGDRYLAVVGLEFQAGLIFCLNMHAAGGGRARSSVPQRRRAVRGDKIG